jgi:hypothetical protein
MLHMKVLKDLIMFGHFESSARKSIMLVSEMMNPQQHFLISSP